MIIPFHELKQSEIRAEIFAAIRALVITGAQIERTDTAASFGARDLRRAGSPTLTITIQGILKKGKKPFDKRGKR